jgi:hypothetical protein
MEAVFSSDVTTPSPALAPFTAPNVTGLAAPPDGGPPIGPEQAWPTPGHTTFREFLHALNPLQYVPVVGSIYRAVTGDTIQPAYRVFGSIVSGVLFGGPAGIMGTALGCLGEEFLRLGWNQPGGIRAPSYAAAAEVGADPQPTIMPGQVPGPIMLAGTRAPAEPAAAPAATAYPNATTIFESDDVPDLSSRLAQALGAYGKVMVADAAPAQAWAPAMGAAG